MKKQVLLLFAALLFSQAAFAYDFSARAPSGQTLYYTILSDSTSVEVAPDNSYYSWGSGNNLVIPNSVTYNGINYPVTSIGQAAFRYCTGLDSVTIPNSVTSIGSGAFRDCGVRDVGGIIYVSIPNSVTSIGDGAFGNCSRLTSVTIPNSVTSIGASAFIDCSGLTSITLSSSLSSISSSAFEGCGRLTSVTIPNSVTSIGANAFSCSGLTSITIPNSVTSIGYSAFSTCTGLTSVTIPNSVTSIGEGAFCGCSGLTSVTIPNSVTSIGDKAFSGCSGLTSVSIPNSVTSIGYCAFYGCSGLTSITIPNSVTSIGNVAFSGCSGLTSVSIPNSVTSIGNEAFEDCSGLTSVSISNSVTSIGYEAFEDCSGLTSITIPNSVTNIGGGAFRGCSGLTSVTFNAVNCTLGGTMNNTVFRDCTNITSFTFGNNVRFIPPYVCFGLTGLTSVTIPDSVTNIGEGAFYGCSGLTSVTFNANYCTSAGSSNSSPYSYAYAFGYFQNITSFTFGNNVRTIPSYLCYGLSGLTSVVIPNSVSSIGDSAFCGCSGLTSVTIPNSVTSIGDKAFRGCSGLTAVHYTGTIGQWCGITFGGGYSNPLLYAHHLYINNAEVTTASIPNTVTEIKPYAFYNCTGLTSVTIPNSVTSIGYCAFYGCSGLTSITIPNSVTSIGQAAFSGCSGLTSLTIGNSVTSIGNYAFSGCSGLTSVTFNAVNCTSAGTAYNPENPVFRDCTNITSFTFGNNVRFIPPYVCYGLTGLTSVTIPDSVANIGGMAFYGCTGLTSLTIGNSVTSIGQAAFYNCSGLSSITFLGSTPPYLGNDVFSAVPTNIPVYIPCGSLTNYESQLPYFTNYIETEQQFVFSAVSADESRGTVQVLTEPTCANPNAVLNAVPANGYRFDHWSTGSTDNPDTLTVTSGTVIIAYFDEISIPTYTVTVYADNPASGSVTGGGVFEEGATITISATPNIGYRFVRWNDNNTDNPRTVVCEGNATYIAYFAQDLPTYHIDVVSADPTMGSAMGSGDYAENSSVTISAIPNSGYHFTCWQDNVTSNPRTITVTGNATYTAYFESDGGGEQPSDNAPSIACVGVDQSGHNVVRWEPCQGVSVVRYNIYREGLGGYSQVGYVNATSATEYSWVDDNSNTATQAYSYKLSKVSANGTESDLSQPHTTVHLQISQGQGTTWNLSWTPYVGFNYSGYRIYRGTTSASMSLLTELSSSATTYSDNAPSGDVYYQIEVAASNGAKSITASSRSNIATSVQNQQFTITVLSDNSSMGMVSGGGTFAQGSTTTISATPLSGYHFTHWNDGSTKAQRTITVTGNATYTAYFTAGSSEPQQYLITVALNNHDRGTVSGGGFYDAGAVITITAEPFAGFEFVKWQDGNTSDFRTITVTADATYTAYFRTATQGIDDVEAADNLKVYTRGNTIVIDFSGQQAAGSRQNIVVYDVMGRVIKQTADSGHQAVVEIPVTSAGVYMVKVGDQPSRKVLVRP